MLKTMESGVTWSYPLDKKTGIKCEGHYGYWSILDAATYDGRVYVLLEHNTYGDDTPFLLTMLPSTLLRWYVIENPSKDKTRKYFYIPKEDIINDGWDSIEHFIIGAYNYKPRLEDIKIWTDEEIDNMEAI